jgi:16S rRNA (guanine527-N7)-methyltransferase
VTEVTAVEAEPPVAQQVFGERLDVVRRYADDLGRLGVELGLIGPQEPQRLWTRHVLNCGLVAPLLRPGTTVADIGSGAGLPGLVLAASRPDCHFTLIEPMLRRTDWLESESERLGLDNVVVVRDRAESVTARFDVVTARAVGAVKTLVPITAPLVAPGGELLLMKGAGVDAELGAATSVLRRFRLTEVRVEILGAGMATEETRVLRATVHKS